MKYTKSRPGEIEYKYNYSDDFKVLNVFGKKPQRPSKQRLPQAYQSRLEISHEKKKDILNVK